MQIMYIRRRGREIRYSYLESIMTEYNIYFARGEWTFTFLAVDEGISLTGMTLNIVNDDSKEQNLEIQFIFQSLSIQRKYCDTKSRASDLFPCNRWISPSCFSPLAS